MNPFLPDWKPGEDAGPPPKRRPMPVNGIFDRLLRRREFPDAVRVPALLLIGVVADLEQTLQIQLDRLEDGFHNGIECLERLRKGGSR